MIGRSLPSPGDQTGVQSIVHFGRWFSRLVIQSDVQYIPRCRSAQIVANSASVIGGTPTFKELYQPKDLIKQGSIFTGPVS